MHAGCRVFNFGAHFDGLADTTTATTSNTFDGGLESATDISVICTKTFTEHESMAYGADWLVCPHPTRNGYFEAAAR